ncbi:TPA: replication protein [Enterococcus faecium]|uniref:primase C-terminal domain-containing protein n=1 Tax=Enterococcus TaxID=1350 RepID=UPI0010C33A9E|nr:MULTISPECIES: primase C-terminal domain-containing protein [Enterococcus]MBG0355265.1 primase C-terminal domain-containing protein [Enterococcus faecium]MCD5186564.1 primase C-terminal domain-containing protein [Enterococcus gallinarum]NTK97473.1 primase C-terminal domain-containing protein [Enterococcus faecium]NTM84428.1 primase C-terminal domain-containing protein [Enterococcus faecium]NTN38497.1 primase C-terminal domain-containing protein [Enterococcus faecium]
MLDRQAYMDVLEGILKDGLQKFNSKNVMPLNKSVNKKGAIVGFESKGRLIQSQGIIYRSLEKLYADSELLTHWTPNVFSWIGGGKGQSVWGHREDNLIQINTFVADIDFLDKKDKISLNSLVLYLLEEGLLPYLILDTPKGYHAYFLIKNYNEESREYDKASYISNANGYKSLHVAKRISENIRKAIKNRLPEVDMGCNHFGVFRFPTPRNIVHFEPNFTNTFEGYLEWSKEFERKEKEKKKGNMTVLSNKTRIKSNFRQIDTKWYDYLIHADIEEGDRNSVIFTLSLACKQSGLSMEQCIDQMDQIEFKNDLSNKEVQRTIKSAYEGAYSGAKGFYINELLEKYTTPSQFKKYAVATENKMVYKRKGNRVDPCYWVKFAKNREERTYSHFSESQDDLMAYLKSKEKQLNENQLYLELNMVNLSEETKIPLSTLKVIIKELKQDKDIIVKTKRGRNGSTKIATRRFVEVKVLMAVISRNKGNKLFATELLEKDEQTLVEEIISRYENKALPFSVDKEKVQREKIAPIRGATG